MFGQHELKVQDY